MDPLIYIEYEGRGILRAVVVPDDRLGLGPARPADPADEIRIQRLSELDGDDHSEPGDGWDHGVL